MAAPHSPLSNCSSSPMSLSPRMSEAIESGWDGSVVHRTTSSPQARVSGHASPTRGHPPVVVASTRSSPSIPLPANYRGKLHQPMQGGSDPALFSLRENGILPIGELEHWVGLMAKVVEMKQDCVTALPDEILPDLYLGDINHAKNPTGLNRIGITHVLNCAPAAVDTDARTYQPFGMTYKGIEADDDFEYDLVRRHMDEAKRFIDSGRRSGGKVLIHCFAGINRSATLCIAYLMITKRVPLLKAVRYVFERRACILHNRGFMAQLVLLAKVNHLLQ